MLTEPFVVRAEGVSCIKAAFWQITPVVIQFCQPVRASSDKSGQWRPDRDSY